MPNAPVAYTYIRTTRESQAADSDGGAISFTDLECDPPGPLVNDDARLAGPLPTGKTPLLR